MWRQHSVSDVMQLIPVHFPHIVDAGFSMRDKVPQCDFPIAIAFGDRDYLCSRGSDELIRASKQFGTGRSQLFKVADSSHFMHQD